jgi:hypothetical protein
MLRANPAPAGETLRIVRAINDISANCFYFEVPISYDQLRQHGLLDIDKARFDLSVNQHEVGASPPARANNGNCYCTCAASDLLAGTNQLQVEFLMFGKFQRIFVLLTPVLATPIQIAWLYTPIWLTQMQPMKLDCLI